MRNGSSGTDSGKKRSNYYGPRIPDDDLRGLLRLDECPFSPDQIPGARASFYDAFPFEYPAWGGGNFREPCLRVVDSMGGGNCELFYESHRILPGKPKLEGLPDAFGPEGECSTLEIVCLDPALGLRTRLLYTVFDDVDAICRSVRIENGGTAPVELSAALSASLERVGTKRPLPVAGNGRRPHRRGLDERRPAAGRIAIGFLQRTDRIGTD